MLWLYLQLAFATAVVLSPGWLLARTLGVRSVSASLAWALVAVFGALAVMFAVGSTLTLTLILLALVAASALVLGRFRRWPQASAIPRRGWVVFWGAIVGVLLWIAAPSVQGDGLFHLARARKLLDLDDLSLERVSEFADGSLHPGYAFPLWHGFLALIAKLSGEDPERVVMHLPSILAPLAVLVAFEAGWALFRRTWAAGVTAAAQVAMIAFASRHGRGLRLPLAPGHLVAAAPRAGGVGVGAGVRAVPGARAGGLDSRSRARARRGAPDVLDLPLDPVPRLPGRACPVGAEGFCARARSRSARSSFRPRCSCSGCGRS